MAGRIEDLKDEISKIRGNPDSEEQILTKAASKTGGDRFGSPNVKARRILKGHYGKLYACHWAPDSKNLVSASQDGRLIVWSGLTTNKLHAILLRSSWVMTCAYSPDGSMVASGGLDNVVSVYKLVKGESVLQKTYLELAQHDGYLSCVRFVSDRHIISASGDKSCILWDLEKGASKAVFHGHTSDAMAISVSPDKNYFVSGSVDGTAKLWDIRAPEAGAVKTFTGHESDINAVSFFPTGNVFASGSDDSSCRLYDIRAYRQVNRYVSDSLITGVTAVDFTASGKYLVSSYEDNSLRFWDILRGTIEQQVTAHDSRVSCLQVAPDGKAIVTGGWDYFLKIWA